jgi:hypothetical protein
MRFDVSDVGVGGFRLDDDRLKLRKILGAFELILQVTERDTQAIRDSGEIFVDKSGIVAEKKDAEGRIVVDQDAAIAIEHAAARSDDGNGANAIALGHLTVLIGIDDLEFPEAEEQQSDHAHDDVGGDGQSGLWQTIVVAKPVRHENPARECFLLRSSNGQRFPQGDSSPLPREAGTCSRHEKNFSVGFEMSVENFFRKKRIRKIPSGLPNHCRTCAAFTQQSHLKRSTWERGPQAVLKDSCLGNTLGEMGRVDGAAPEGEAEVSASHSWRRATIGSAARFPPNFWRCVMVRLEVSSSSCALETCVLPHAKKIRDL